jgi:hypothetical protein
MVWNYQSAADVVLQYLQIEMPSDENEMVVKSVLEASKSIGTNADFRPFIAAAALCSTMLLRNGVIEADGVVFEKTSEVIEGLLAIQAAFDQTVGIVPPPGWSVNEFRTNMSNEVRPVPVMSAMIAY